MQAAETRQKDTKPDKNEYGSRKENRRELYGKKLNTGILKCDRTEKGDEAYTPFYAVEPILKYIPQEWTVWCPFDEKWSAYVRLLRENGRRVVRSSLADGQDFFSYEPKEWDVIVGNPPFSKKDRVLERLYSLGKPFAVLLPLAALQGRYRHLKNGVELLAFDRRISFYMGRKSVRPASGCAFASAYFCRGVLPEKLVLEEIRQYDRPLWEWQKTVDFME